MRFSDRLQLDASDVRKTQDGYLIATPRVGRSGIQLYLGSEVGMKDQAIVRVYRPPEEVFSEDAMRSIAHRPMTNNHPPDGVDASTWKEHAIGQVGGDVVRDGNFVRVPLIMMDANAVVEFEQGKRELSLGYSADLEFTSGKTEDGQAYDAVQKNIRVNHLALVQTARGGEKLRIGDNQEVKTMADRTITVDGIDVKLDDMAANIVQRALKDAAEKLGILTKQVADLSAQVTSLKQDADKKEAEFATKMKQKEEEAEAEKKKAKDAAISPEKLDALVLQRVNVVTKAKSMLGDGFKFDGKSDAAIMREVVASKLGDTAKDWNDVQIEASFNTLVSDVKRNNVDDATRAFGGAPVGATTKVDEAYGAFVSHLSDAWKRPSGDKAA